MEKCVSKSWLLPHKNLIPEQYSSMMFWQSQMYILSGSPSKQWIWWIQCIQSFIDLAMSIELIKVNVSVIVFFGGWHFCVCIFFVWVWFVRNFLLSNPSEPHVITGSETGWKCGVYRVSAGLQTSVLVNTLSVLSILWDKTRDLLDVPFTHKCKENQPCHWEIFEVILKKNCLSLSTRATYLFNGWHPHPQWQWNHLAHSKTGILSVSISPLWELYH